MSLPELRRTPGRLLAAAYAPFGSPLGPDSDLSRSLPGSRFVSYTTVSNGGTPPPPYSDIDQDYDTFPAYMSSDGGDEYYQDVDQFEEEDEEVEIWEEQEDEVGTAGEQVAHDVRPVQGEILAFGPMFTPQELSDRLATTTASNIDSDDDSDFDLDFSVIPTPQILQSSPDTPQLVNEQWSFPVSRLATRSTLLAQEHISGLLAEIQPEEADCQPAPFSHFNVASPPAETEDAAAVERSVSIGYAGASRGPHLGREDGLNWGREEQDTSDRREIRRDRERRERAQRELERNQAEVRDSQREAAYNAANQRLQQRARGPATPPLPPRPTGQTPRLIAHYVRSRHRLPYPPQLPPPTDPLPPTPDQLHLLEATERLSYIPDNSHGWPSPNSEPLPNPFTADNTSQRTGPSTPSPHRCIRQGGEKPLPPLPTQSRIPLQPTPVQQALHPRPLALTYRVPPRNAANVVYRSGVPTLRLRPALTGQQLAERYHRR